MASPESTSPHDPMPSPPQQGHEAYDIGAGEVDPFAQAIDDTGWFLLRVFLCDAVVFTVSATTAAMSALAHNWVAVAILSVIALLTLMSARTVLCDIIAHARSEAA